MKDNDQDKLFEKVDKLEEEWNEIDSEIEEVSDMVHDDEEVPGDDEETTELSKALRDREERKNALIASYAEPRDKALFDEENVRKEKSLLLEQLEKSIDQDLETIRILESEIPAIDPLSEIISDIGDKLEEQKAKASDLSAEFHENDLPPLSGQDTGFKQDSSDVHQTEFDPSDHYDDF